MPVYFVYTSQSLPWLLFWMNFWWFWFLSEFWSLLFHRFFGPSWNLPIINQILWSTNFPTICQWPPNPTMFSLKLLYFKFLFVFKVSFVISCVSIFQLILSRCLSTESIPSKWISTQCQCWLPWISTLGQYSGFCVEHYEQSGNAGGFQR